MRACCRRVQAQWQGSEESELLDVGIVFAHGFECGELRFAEHGRVVRAVAGGIAIGFRAFPGRRMAGSQPSTAEPSSSDRRAVWPSSRRSPPRRAGKCGFRASARGHSYRPRARPRANSPWPRARRPSSSRPNQPRQAGWKGRTAAAMRSSRGVRARGLLRAREPLPVLRAFPPAALSRRTAALARRAGRLR